jgi:ankyrin repeat protein
MARRLLDAGARSAAETSKGQTALDFAREKGHTAVVDLLTGRAERGK